jgi:superfamily II DNA or RNA helicase
LFHGDLDEARVIKLSRQLGDIREHLMSQSDRAKMLARFESGDLRRVIGTAILGTGVSANECQIVTVASGSGATISFRQSIGRASRKAQGKTHATAVIPVDSFHRSYRARALKLVASAKKEGHTISRLEPEEVAQWLPPS